MNKVDTLILPKGWELKKLEDLGADIPYPIGDGDHGQIKPKDYTTEGVPSVGVNLFLKKWFLYHIKSIKII